MDIVLLTLSAPGKWDSVEIVSRKNIQTIADEN